VSLGPKEIVLEYVHSMAQEANRIGKWKFGAGGHDQPIHNYLIRTHAFNFPVHPTKSTDGIIATLQYYNKNRIIVDGGDTISIEKGISPSIIHQYDRFPELSEYVDKIYG
jgi:hypothetical protein